MNPQLREERISAALVSVADLLTTEFDSVELLHTLLNDCVDILDMAAGGLMLTDADGVLHLVTTTSHAAEFVEVMALNSGAGPCIESFLTGDAVSVRNIADEQDRWPEFCRAALAQGFQSALATPMTLRGTVIGTMNLFSRVPGATNGADAALARALAAVATIGILQERIISEGNLLEEQLRHALDSRVVIEQAKGIVANSLTLSMDEAFGILRKYSRDNNVRIHSVSTRIVSGELAPAEMAR